MSNISVTTSFSNVAVNTQSNVISVTSTPSNITISGTNITSNVGVRSALSNTSPITYNVSSGVFGIDSTAFTSN